MHGKVENWRFGDTTFAPNYSYFILKFHKFEKRARERDGEEEGARATDDYIEKPVIV